MKNLFAWRNPLVERGAGFIDPTTGSITDAEHGVRTLANAHAHNALSGLEVGDPHSQYSTQVEFDDHSARHEQGGIDVVVPALHASRHNSGGADVLTGLARFFPTALTPALVGANTTAEQTFTVTGLAVNDTVIVNKPTHQAGLGIVGARVSATDTLAITYGNFTGAGITPTSETYRVTVLR